MISGVTKMSSRGQVVIPLGVRENINEGDKLIVIRQGDDIILKKCSEDLALLSEESFAEIWLNKKEDEAWENL